MTAKWGSYEYIFFSSLLQSTMNAELCLGLVQSNHTGKTNRTLGVKHTRARYRWPNVNMPLLLLSLLNGIVRSLCWHSVQCLHTYLLNVLFFSCNGLGHTRIYAHCFNIINSMLVWSFRCSLRILRKRLCVFTHAA